MKLIKPSFEIIEQQPGLEGIYKQIERAGRTCYRSESKITEDSAKSFVDRMIKSGHGAMLEHGTVYLYAPCEDWDTDDDGYVIYYCDLDRYKKNKYSKFNQGYVTTNYRVLVENGWLGDLKYLCKPTKYHAKRITVMFICDRGVSHEFVRHRVFSFAQESTRYCNYSKDKFNNEITCILPVWSKLPEGEYEVDCIALSKIGQKERVDYTPDEQFLEAITNAEWNYFHLLQLGWTPQQARAVLPNALKTELVMTGFVDDWWGEYLVIDKSTGLIDQRIHGKFYDELNNIDRDKYRIVEKGFFPLRCSSGAHPQAQELAIPLREEFVKRGY